MRRFVIGGVLGVFVLSVVLVACGGSGPTRPGTRPDDSRTCGRSIRSRRTSTRPRRRRTSISMMSLYAPNATMTVGPGATASGAGRDPAILAGGFGALRGREQLDLGSPRVQARDHDQRRPGHAALRVPLRRRRDRRGRVGHGRRLRRGPDRREVADHEHGRRDDGPGSLRSWPRSTEPRVAVEGRRRIGDPLVRAVARLPATVRTKLLIAFVGTSLLLVAVGLLGQLVLGQSNDRVASVGPLQERAVQYSQLQAEAESPPGCPGGERRDGLQRRLAGCSASRDPRDVLARGRPVCASTRPSESHRRRLRISSVSRRLADDRMILQEITDQGRSLCEVASSSELIPLYVGPNDRDRRRGTIGEMLPLRAQAEDYASDLATRTPRDWRTGRERRSRI